MSCTKQTECIVIQNKYGGNGNFYFEWDRSNGLNSSNLQLGTGSVSEEIYNQYDIGDTYCIEELMLQFFYKIKNMQYYEAIILISSKNEKYWLGKLGNDNLYDYSWNVPCIY